MILRNYQQKAIIDIRKSLSEGFKSVCFQLCTGAGKTVIFSEIARLARENGNSCWLVVPRIHLATQASEHLSDIGVPHAHIAAGTEESRAFTIHVCSAQTLKRRIEAGKIKNFPKIVIFDECHINLDFQLYIMSHSPEGTIFIGVTATPERFDGRGLSEAYQSIVYGPPDLELVELDYLSNIRYFKPPEINGLSDLKRVQTAYGIEYDNKQMKAIFQNKAIWGDMIDMFTEYRKPKQTSLIFCRSVELSDQAETNFQHAGYKIFSIHGKTPKKKQIELLRMARSGEIDGLATCDLLCYGVDIKRIEFIMPLRFTGSVALYKQIIGRGLRPWEDKNTGYVKRECTIVDPVGNIKQHGHPLSGRDWNFYGVDKHKIEKNPHADTAKFCPECCLYFPSGVPICPNCGNQRKSKKRGDLVEVDGRLVEAEPIKLAERPLEEKREFSDRMSNLKEQYAEETGKPEPDLEIVAGIVGEYLEIAEDLSRKPMWVYQMLNNLQYAVNDPLLYEICRIKEYKKGWIWQQRQQLEGRF